MTPITADIKQITRPLANSGISTNSLILEHRGNSYHLHGGTKDTIHIFTESIAIYVLTINKALGYIGLNAYITPEPDPINSCFIHSPQELKETLGTQWEQMDPLQITRRLIDYLY